MNYFSQLRDFRHRAPSARDSPMLLIGAESGADARFSIESRWQSAYWSRNRKFALVVSLTLMAQSARHTGVIASAALTVNAAKQPARLCRDRSANEAKL
jgi:hypothetical protein